MCLFIGSRAMLDAAGHDEQLAWGELDVAVAQLDREPAGEDEEEVVGLVVLVPHELAVCLDDLDLVVVQIPDDARAEWGVEQRELLREVDLVFHRPSLPLRHGRRR
jgi:hypothetical protein